MHIQINDDKAICLLYIVVKKRGRWLMTSAWKAHDVYDWDHLFHYQVLHFIAHIHYASSNDESFIIRI